MEAGRISIGSTAQYFITGATGLIGAECVYHILSHDSRAKVDLLVRAKNQQAAELRINRLFRTLFPTEIGYARMRPRARVLCGDIRHPKLGLSEALWLHCTRHTHYIIHAAAITDWEAPKAYFSAANVKGVQHMLTFARACSSLRRMLHLSSAYVCGERSGIIEPGDIDTEVPVSDWYQASKRSGEQLVLKHRKTLPIVIARPTHVVGNSDNGRTHRYHGVYRLGEWLYQGERVVLPVTEPNCFDVVPVDWAVNLMIRLLHLPQAEGRCFHLALGERAYSATQVCRIIQKSMDKLELDYKPIWQVAPRWFNIIHGPLMNRERAKEIRQMERYYGLERYFDASSTFRITGEDRHKLPGLESYCHKLFAYALKRRWEKLQSKGGSLTRA